jgi:uncharacterized membrane protein
MIDPLGEADGMGGEQGEPRLDLEHLWQFAGQSLRSSDFTAAMIHFYRGEVSRSNTWRGRLDATTNWAVLTTGATLSFAFSNPDHPATLILINTLLILLFLFIEARRYRYYELSSYRVRLLEMNFFAGLLAPPFVPHQDWADKLTESINHPTFPISLLEAFGRRYRRNYAPIFLILAVSWMGKISLHPTMTADWNVLLERTAIGPLPGTLVLLVGLIFNAVLLFLGLYTVGLRQATGEILEEGPGNWLANLGRRFRQATWEALEVELHLPRIPRFDTRKQLVYIISDEVETIGKALLSELKRGVTLLHGTGLYTGREHGVLLCALQARQMSALRQIVHEKDSNAFVIITPVQDVRGFGFRPLEA